MRWAALLLPIALAGCGGGAGRDVGASAGGRLEQAAIATGLVVDPAARSIVGAWARDTDRACIVPGEGGLDRIGILIDYGQGQGCAASGTVRRHGDDLDVKLDGCQLTARFDGSRLVFPAEVPPACDRSCAGRASLAALSVERQSESASEATSLRSPSGRPLCGA